MVMASIISTIYDSVGVLKSLQGEEGSFGIYSDAKITLDYNPEFDRSPFTTFTIVYVLDFLRKISIINTIPDIDIIQTHSISYLIRQMYPPGVWSFFDNESRNRIASDLDDTACISFVLKTRHPHIAFGSNIPILLKHRDENGLFNTWIVPSGVSNDVDSVVNSNILLYIGRSRYTEPIISS